MLALFLAAAVLVGYGLSLWWLLRRESAAAMVWLVGLTGLSVSLRLVYTTEFPPGMNEDEVKILWCSIDLLRAGQIFVDDCTGIPALLSVIFDAQLATWIGASRWAVRGLSFLGGTLAVPAGYAAARSLGLRVAASLAAAGFIAVLPWALLYGRVHQSGEMVFEALLLAACLARFLHATGSWPEVLIGGCSLALLMQTYYSGRALVGLTLVALVLAPGRFRLHCLGVLMIAFAVYAPYYLSGAKFATVGVSDTFVEPGMREHPIDTIGRKAGQAFHALVAPVAWDNWLTIRAAAIHPVWILALAFIGALTGGRRALFLWAGFLGGIAPAIIGHGIAPSARRMLMGFPFLALAAASALDLVPWRRLRLGVVVAVFAITAVASVRFFFSSDFWIPQSLWVFEGPWRLVEGLPPPPLPHLVASKDLGYYFSPRAVLYHEHKLLSVDNWYPTNSDTPQIYAFAHEFRALMPVYMHLFGLERVHVFGVNFYVKLEPADWSWLRANGWSYRASYGDVTRTGQVPFLLQIEVVFEGLDYSKPSTHEWRGRWLGPPSTLRFRGRGKMEVEVDGAVVLQSEAEGSGGGDFAVIKDSHIVVREQLKPSVLMLAQIFRVTPAGEQVPPLEWVAPDAF